MDLRSRRGRGTQDGPRLHGPLLAVLGEDLRRHGGQWHRPGFHTVALHRIAVWQRGLPGLLRYPVALVYGALYFVTRNLYGIELPRTAIVGRRLLIGHQSGIVVSEIATIGDDCVIRQNVTIGVAQWGDGPAPTIGDRVEIGAGAVILGDITIGDDVFIGSNAVVTKDVPAGARVVAPEARVVPTSLVSPTASAPSDEDVEAPTRELSLESVQRVISAEIGFGLPGPDAPFLSSGLVDSLRVAGLLDALEESFAVRLTVDDLDAASFDTARDVFELISGRTSR